MKVYQVGTERMENFRAGFPVFEGKGNFGNLEYTIPVDAHGHEVVQVDGGDLGRAGPDGHALKHLSDGRWLVCIEASSEKKLIEKLVNVPPGYVHFGAEQGFPPAFPVYGPSGGVAHTFISYLIYKQKPEEA
jgi:hypothetical protein